MEEYMGATTTPKSGASKGPLRVLIVEDNSDDVELVLAELARHGYDVTHVNVQTARDMRTALSSETFDLMISDYSLPTFSGLAALTVLKETGIDLPFIMISGTIGEETAVDALKAGAHDFLVKTRLARLVPAIDRELREALSRRGKREAEAALRASEERFRALTETAPDAVVSGGGEGRIVYANRAAEGMFHIAAAGIVGQHLTSLFPERFGDMLRSKLALHLESPNANPLGTASEVCARRADGTEFPVDISLASWNAGQGTSFTAVIRDLTERKKIEAHLLVADRMASVGTLAAGVAHEINNPLAALMSNLELASGDIADLEARSQLAGELPELIGEARAAADRVRVIVRDLKIFSRGDEERQGPVDVHRVLETSIRIAWNEIRHRARLARSFGDVALANANESRLGQVFLNLLVNAAQAIPEGNASANEIRVATRSDPSGSIVVEISDTGTGMSPEVLQRLFLPFFTTKPVGVGTGLGLSICHRIVTALGGDITVESAPGRGSLFRVTLPPTTIEQRPSPMPQQVSRASKRGRVLVIDDERTITTAVARILSREHEVEALTSAKEALSRLEGGERYDVILCDLMMPHMTGMELHAKLVGLGTGQASRMVFFTGGAFTPQARAFIESVRNARLEKPFDALNLRNVVNSLVDRRSGSQ
jgi:PAS domain S-box-containing protein